MTCGVYGRNADYAVSVHHHVINRPGTPVVSKIDMHAGAGADSALDGFPFAVEHVTGTFENELAPTLVVNNESSARLIACHLASFNRYGRALSGYGKSPFHNSYSCHLQTLSESQRRNECAAGKTDYYFLHNDRSFHEFDCFMLSSVSRCHRITHAVTCIFAQQLMREPLTGKQRRLIVGLPSR